MLSRHADCYDVKYEMHFSAFRKLAEKYLLVGMNSLGTLRRVYWEWSVVCKFILFVFSGGDSLLFFIFLFFGLKSGGSLSPDLVVVLDAHVLECYLGHKFKVSSSICFKRSQIWSFIALERPPT